MPIYVLIPQKKQRFRGDQKVHGIYQCVLHTVLHTIPTQAVIGSGRAHTIDWGAKADFPPIQLTGDGDGAGERGCADVLR